MESNYNIEEHLVDRVSSASETRQPQNWDQQHENIRRQQMMHPQQILIRELSDADFIGFNDEGGFDQVIKEFENKMAATFRTKMNESMQYLKRKNEHLKLQQKKLTTDRQRLQKDQENFEKHMKKRNQEIQNERLMWEKEKQSVNEKAKNSDQIVKLNVGGNLKEVSRELLTAVNDSLLKKTFSGKHNLKTVNGSVFLDRDPKIFDMVLNYLRYDTHYIPKNVSEEVKRLFDMEIQFWGIEQEQYIEMKLPQNLVELLKSEPSFDLESEKQQCTLSKWRELGPINLLEIQRSNGINLEQQLNFGEKQFDTQIYNGQLDCNNKTEGIGRCLWKKNHSGDGKIYEGQYKNGKLCGYGRYIWPSGNYYIGMWKNGQMHGKGKFVFSNGQVEDGMHENNKFVGQQ